MSKFAFENKDEIYLAPKASLSQIKTVYDNTGVVVLKGYLKEDPWFTQYLADLTWCATQIAQCMGLEFEPEQSFEGMASLLFKADPLSLLPLWHLGTMPNKLTSGNKLKYSDSLISIAQAILGKASVMASPFAGDSLIAFLPGKSFDDYVLPLHEDFPYLLQSARQVTFWISLSPFFANVGGIQVWLGSHKQGPHKAKPKRLEPEGHYEAIISPEALAQYPCVNVNWEMGDLIVISTHLLHQGIPNTHEEHLRIIQLFRYSDLNEPEAIDYRWYSKTYPAKGTDIKSVYPIYKK